MTSSQTASMFPKDIIERAQNALQQMPGGMGRLMLHLLSFCDHTHATTTSSHLLLTLRIYSPSLWSTGAYSHSQGLHFVRKSIAQFIQRRDGYETDPDSLFTYNGASPAVQNVLRLVIRGEKDGV
jgi:hypothetical protein